MRLLTPILLVPVLALACATSPAKTPPPKPAPAGTGSLDRAILKPAATGLLVVTVRPDSQAERMGLRPGDIVVSYAGKATPTVQALNEAKNASEGTVTLGVNRHGKKMSPELEPGTIGVTLIPIVEGEGKTPLPPATVTSFDFKPLEGDGRDDWFVFLQNGERTGYGRIRARLLGNQFVVLTEEIYEDGDQFLDHEVTSIAAEGTEIVMTSFRDRMNDWERFGVATGGTWNVLSRGPGSEGEPFTAPLAEGTVPAYMLETLASLMPRKKGECFRFTPMFEGSGRTGLENALVAIGPEEIEIGGRKVQAWRVEWRGLTGDTSGTFWIGPEGRLDQAVYGDMTVIREDADEVLEGQPESILSR